jgi:hypothetical protein
MWRVPYMHIGHLEENDIDTSIFHNIFKFNLNFSGNWHIRCRRREFSGKAGID